MMRVLLLFIGYLCGLFQTGYLYGKSQGIDIRTKGSGNAGATNSLRVMGVKAGAIVFLGDVLKTFIPCLAVYFIFREQAPELVYLYLAYIAFGVVLGHNYPFYLHFKGGKGIACSVGLIMCLQPVYGVCLIGLFALIVICTRYVSLGSLTAVLIGVILVIRLAFTGYYGLSDPGQIEFSVLIFLWGALAFWQHRANIGRLLTGTENKISIGKKK